MRKRKEGKLCAPFEEPTKNTAKSVDKLRTLPKVVRHCYTLLYLLLLMYEERRILR